MTTAVTPDPDLVRMYEEAEQEYLRSVPPEHFMEATDHTTHRKIKLESAELMRKLTAARDLLAAERRVREAVERQAEAAARRAELAERSIDAERQARLAAEAELARLREELAKSQGQ